MADMLGILFYVFLIVTVITLVGHGIWALLAMMFRMSGSGGGRPRTDSRQCVFCGRMTQRAHSRCDWCGRELHDPMADELADVDATRRQLVRWRRGGVLGESTVKNLLARLDTYRRRLLEPSVKEEPLEAEIVEPQPKLTEVPRPIPKPPTVKPALPRRLSPNQPSSQPTPAIPTPPQPTPPQPKPKPAPPQPVAPRPAPVQPAPPQPVVIQRPVVPPPPKKTWTETLAGFMEERNIRWGELIGGLLIVGSSAALVLSLWDTLEAIPYFPFLIFVAITSAIFGVGLYAYHRWKLESTSRGMLTIATLLVPLNFLAMAALPGEGIDSLTLVMDVAALGLFVWLVGLAARVLVPDGQWFQVAAVLGNSAAVLLVAGLIDREPGDGLFLAAGFLPVACFAGAIGGYLWKLAPCKQLKPTEAGALFTLLGVSTFALTVTLGLLISRAVSVGAALDRLSVWIALAAISVLGAGLTVVRATARKEASAAYHTAGTMVALVGMFAMLAALGMAWPHPMGIIVVGSINCVALAAAAFYYRLPVLHAGAIACAALVYLTGFHVIFNDLMKANTAEMFRLMLDGSSGTALGGMFLLLAAASELLARRGYRRHGSVYAGGCAVVAVLGLLLVTFNGIADGGADAIRATILYAIYGIVSLGLAARWRREEFSYAGLSLLCAAPMWLLWRSPQTHEIGHPWATLAAAEALLMGLAAVVLSVLGKSTEEETDSTSIGPLLAACYRIPLLTMAEVVAPVAVFLTIVARIVSGPVDHSIWPPLTAGCLGATWLLLAWQHRSVGRTWAGSMIVLVGLFHTLRYNYVGLVDQPELVALLTHSTLAVVAGLLLNIASARRSDRSVGDEMRNIFAKPLGDTALLSSVLVLPVLPLISWASTLSLAGCLFWLAALWLIVSWQHRDARLFAAHQAMLALAALVATTAWLESRTVGFLFPNDLLDAGNLQVYGISLALLSLMWATVRIASRGNTVAVRLLDPEWPAVDWIVRHAVVWLQLLLVAWHLLPGVGHELLATGPTAGAQASEQTAAWLLLLISGAALAVTLWNRWRDGELTSCLLLAAVVPCLIAGRFAPDLAVASALRWVMACGFIGLSAAVWGRTHLLRLCRVAGARIEVGDDGPRIARAVVLLTTAVPVLVLTVMAAMLQLSGTSSVGPLADTFFDRIGSNVSYIVPLVLVLIGLVGHAVRERSAAYAFSAGLVAELIVTLGYALWIATNPNRSFDVAELVTLIQLATIMTAVWAGCWLAIRRWLNVWREEPEAGSAATSMSSVSMSSVLMNVQFGMGAVGNLLLLVVASFMLALIHPHDQEWSVAVGSFAGWIALISVAAAYVYRRLQAGLGLRPQLVGSLGMAVLVLSACTVEAYTFGVYQPSWGFRTLMFGLASYSLFIASAIWWVASVRTAPSAQGPPQALIRMADRWVRLSGILAVLLGLKTAFWNALTRQQHEELLWAAASIAVASAACAIMAVWRRKEGWAFSAALGVNLAASLAVWHFRHEMTFDQWWLHLLQANVIASSAVALCWLAARRQLYRLREFALGDSPLLALQIAMPVVGLFVLLQVPVWEIVLEPTDLPQWISGLADAQGWIGLLATAAAAGWYLRQTLPGSLLHMLAGLGLGAGVLVACQVADQPDTNAWTASHAMVAAWTIVGLLVLGLGMLGRNWRLVGSQSSADPEHVFPTMFVGGWVTVIGAMVVALATLHSTQNHAGVWWYLGPILATSISAGVLALWLRESAYVYVSGLLLSVIATIAWYVWGTLTPIGPVQANILALAAGSAVWSLLALCCNPSEMVRWPSEAVDLQPVPTASEGHRTRALRVPHAKLGDRELPFAHFAARAAVGLILAVVAFAVMHDVLDGLEHIAIGRFDWIVLSATAGAIAICLWDRTSRFPLAGFYALGLAAVGMALCDRELSPGRLFVWVATCEVAGFVLVAAVAGWLLPRIPQAWQALSIPAGEDRWSRQWFLTAQPILGALGVVLSVWISLDVSFDGVGEGLALFGMDGRMAGVAGLLIAVGTAIVMAWQTDGRWRRGWQCTSIVMGLLLNSSLGFARLDPTLGAPWLNRSVSLMVAAVMMTLLSSLGIGRIVSKGNDWIAAGRRMTPVMGGLALMMLVAVLAQEMLYWVPIDGTPMTPFAIAVVTLALAGLTGICLVFALRSDLDPLGLSDRGRTAYVYAAEALAAMIGLHLWLTVPWLFELGIIEDYWMLIVMVVAFVGAGLSELFNRRGLPVLSEPLDRTALLLPLLPAIGFWLPIHSVDVPLFGGASPMLWLMAGLFYGFMAVSRRSPGLAGLAIFTANIGLWVTWHQLELEFFDRPQLWLIPLALAALIAEHLDRGRLNSTQRTSIRYLALSLIYVSSTYEFMQGVGESVWLPLVLVLLSVLGVLAGIWLRVQSFLYLGVTFLSVVIVRMIVFAAFQQGHMWVFWSCCILLGAAIIALFALFEKRRNDILAAVERLKDWDQ
ncbi:MAG: hypothetical protein V3R99_03090 [Thermoguttaceae bacterium]